jgi:phage head maturation protease
MAKKFDFSGYATKVDLKCSDGRIIRKDAFKHNDGQTVPLVWQHIHNNPGNVLGYALLENREDGVYTYCSFNTTDAGKNAKELVEHGDISSLSIYANELKQKGSDVLHGDIKEVSLVLAGANPGAHIDNLSIQHADGSLTDVDDEAIIYGGEKIAMGEIEHADKVGDNSEKTIQDVFNSMTDEQKEVCYAMIAHALGGEDDKEPEDGVKDDGAKHSDDDQNKDNKLEHKEDDKDKEKLQHKDDKGGNKIMKHNVFDDKSKSKDTLQHSAEDIAAVIADAKRYGSMKESAIAHGITNIDYLFPDATNLDQTPQFIKREMGWVPKVMNAVHHTPFSRIKSTFADITEEDARAKGYITGKLKKEEVFSLLKRTTTPTTVYKKQKLDRDDVSDITDFDVVAWLKAEMRVMLDEELARAILIGDGRLASSDDKINESNIRPIWKDDALYTIPTSFEVAANATDSDNAKAFIKAAIKSRKSYKGSGDPSMFMTEDMLTNCLLIEDTTGRIIYDSVAKLATTLRVKEIITVPVMESLTRTVDSKTMTLHGIMVNLDDYNVGADKGGAVNMFDDFDIDYNAQKYLIETRASGALTKPYSAIVIESTPVVVG